LSPPFAAKTEGQRIRDRERDKGTDLGRW